MRKHWIGCVALVVGFGSAWLWAVHGKWQPGAMLEMDMAGKRLRVSHPACPTKNVRVHSECLRASLRGDREPNSIEIEKDPNVGPWVWRQLVASGDPLAVVEVPDSKWWIAIVPPVCCGFFVGEGMCGDVVEVVAKSPIREVRQRGVAIDALRVPMMGRSFRYYAGGIERGAGVEVVLDTGEVVVCEIDWGDKGVSPLERMRSSVHGGELLMGVTDSKVDVEDRLRVGEDGDGFEVEIAGLAPEARSFVSAVVRGGWLLVTLKGGRPRGGLKFDCKWGERVTRVAVVSM